jgi:hypothetical protein
MNGISRRKVRKAAGHSDFVPLKNPGITLDHLHQSAGFALVGGAALTGTAAAQSRPEFIDRPGGSRKIMPSIGIGI